MAMDYLHGLPFTLLATTSNDVSWYFSGRIPPYSVLTLESYITYDEIKKALFSILDNKALSFDGYTLLFFKIKLGNYW
jgi:hypothetical protein